MLGANINPRLYAVILLVSWQATTVRRSTKCFSNSRFNGGSKRKSIFNVSSFLWCRVTPSISIKSHNDNQEKINYNVELALKLTVQKIRQYNKSNIVLCSWFWKTKGLVAWNHILTHASSVTQTMLGFNNYYVKESMTYIKIQAS